MCEQYQGLFVPGNRTSRMTTALSRVCQTYTTAVERKECVVSGTGDVFLVIACGP